MKRLLLASIPLLAAICTGQVNWTSRSPASSPAGRKCHAMAYDLARQRLVVFGGTDGQKHLGDTWEWDGSSWSQRNPAQSPPALCWVAMEYDLARQQIVLFGGERAINGAENDTWVWDGSNWTQRSPANRPPVRRAHAMTYDLLRRRIVLFGGGGSAGLLSDTWEWDGVNWVQSTASGPSARFTHAMAYDLARGCTVLFGGHDTSAKPLGDTWEYDGTRWIARQPRTTIPAARMYHSLTYDQLRRRTVLIGGTTYWWPPTFPETWEWDGTDWIQRAPTTRPSTRMNHAMAYDLRGQRVLLFGGWDNTSAHVADLWEYGATNPAAYATFGIGCAGSAGIPALAAASGQLPWIGEAFTLELTSLPNNAPAILLFGGSKTSWPPFSLPFSLASIGMFGCTLLASGEVPVPVVASGSSGSFPVPFPNSPSLVTAMFFNQAFVSDPQANRVGLTVTNAGEGRVGAK